MQQRKKILLFDVDGTLIRTGGAGINALIRAFKLHYNLDNPLENVTVAGNTDPNIFREAVSKKAPGKVPTSKEEIAFFESYLLFLKEEITLSKKYRVLPGIKDILIRASTTPYIYVGLGTGNLEKGAKIKLERGGLNPYFSFGGFGSDSSNRDEVLKTAVLKAEIKFNITSSPEDIYVIGDTPKDILSAKAIGAKAIGVATGGYSIQELNHHLPNIVFKNFKEIEGFFEFINGN